jgi:hypothetical protein
MRVRSKQTSATFVVLERDVRRSACKASAHDRSGAARFAVVPRQPDLTTQGHAAASPARPAPTDHSADEASVTFVHVRGGVTQRGQRNLPGGELGQDHADVGQVKLRFAQQRVRRSSVVAAHGPSCKPATSRSWCLINAATARRPRHLCGAIAATGGPHAYPTPTQRSQDRRPGGRVVPITDGPRLRARLH